MQENDQSTPAPTPAPDRMARAAAVGMLFLCACGWSLFVIVGLVEAWHSARHGESARGPLFFSLACGVSAGIAIFLLRDTNSRARFGTARLFQGHLSGLGALALGLSAVLMLLGVFEIAFLPLRYLSSRHPAPNLALEKPANFKKADRFGWLGIPGVFRHRWKEQNGHAGFDVSYTQNELGRRVVPNANDQATRHLLFFGCSFTFGTGLNDEDTLPAQISRERKDLHAYNFGFGGWGPAQPVSLLLSEGFSKEVTEPNGIGVYVFIDDHVRRAISSMKRRNAWTRNFPFYDLDGPSPAYLGPFWKVQPVRTWIYECLPHEQFFAYSGVDWPITPSTADCEYSAKLIAAARDLYLKRFPGSRFYVLIHPLHGDLRVTQAVIDALERMQVPVLNYIGILDAGDPKYSFSDTHPTPIANKIIAQRLATDLGSSP